MTKKICETSVTKDPFKPDWVCTLCFPWMLEIGYVFPFGWLVYNKEVKGSLWSKEYEDGKFAFLKGQGHGEHEILFFDEKPYYVNLDDEYGYDWFQIDSMNVRATLDSLEQIKKYKPDLYGKIMDEWPYQTFAKYLLSRTARLLKNWEKRFNVDVEAYYHKTFFPKQHKAWRKRCGSL